MLDFDTWAQTSSGYAGVDSEMRMRLKTLHFFANRPTVGALMGIGGDLAAAFRSGQPQVLICSEPKLFCECSQNRGHAQHTACRRSRKEVGYSHRVVLLRVQAAQGPVPQPADTPFAKAAGSGSASGTNLQSVASSAAGDEDRDVEAPDDLEAEAASTVAPSTLRSESGDADEGGVHFSLLLSQTVVSWLLPSIQQSGSLMKVLKLGRRASMMIRVLSGLSCFLQCNNVNARLHACQAIW